MFLLINELYRKYNVVINTHTNNIPTKFDSINLYNKTESDMD